MKVKVSASKILNTTEPELLFPNDLDLSKQLFHDLARHYHPDMCKLKNATEVFQKINTLYTAAVAKIESGTWDKTAAETLFRWDFELGKALVSDSELLYRLTKDYSSFANSAQAIVGKFKFKNDKMEKEFSRYLPSQITVAEGSEVSVRTPIPKGYIPLREILRYFGGTLDPKHAAWITSSLLNLACYLDYTGIVHQNISADTYWINPEDHSGILLGGWWYAAPKDQTVSALPKRTHEVLPWSVQVNKTAQSVTDIELIRLLGQEMVGERCSVSAMDLLMGKKAPPRQKVPAPMLNWLKAINADQTAIDVYKEWSTVVVEAFGSRKFTTMVVDRSKLGFKT